MDTEEYNSLHMGCQTTSRCWANGSWLLPAWLGFQPRGERIYFSLITNSLVLSIGNSFQLTLGDDVKHFPSPSNLFPGCPVHCFILMVICHLWYVFSYRVGLMVHGKWGCELKHTEILNRRALCACEVGQALSLQPCSELGWKAHPRITVTPLSNRGSRKWWGVACWDVAFLCSHDWILYSQTLENV